MMGWPSNACVPLVLMGTGCRFAKNVAITMVMNFNADRSGAGTISASGSVIANLAWLKTGKGTMTNVSTNQTKPFTAQY